MASWGHSKMARESGGRALFLLATALLVALVPFAPFLFDSDQVLLYRDLSIAALPAKADWLCGLLREGSILRWNYLQGGGVPFYVDLVGGPLYLLNFLFFLFGEERLSQAFTTY